MSLKMIMATGLNEELGKDNELLWNIPEDLKYFKEQTEGGYVVMGMNTFVSLDMPKGLKNRKNIVLTKYILPVNKRMVYQHNPRYYVHFTKFSKYNDLFDGRMLYESDVWIIGGSSIYDQLIDFVDEIHWTRVEKVYPEANKFLTDKTIDVMIKEFDKGTRIKQGYDEKSDTHFTINVLKRIKQSS